MNINSPYPQNPADISRPAASKPVKSKFWRWLIIALVAIVVLGGGFLLIQKSLRAKAQTGFIKTANETYAADPRYISFGADYLFSVPKSYSVDETTPGLQYLIPSGVEADKLDTFDKLLDAAGLAVWRINTNDIKASDSSDLKRYVEETLVPDLKKNVSEDVKTTFSFVGKYRSSTVVVNKEGRQIRQYYVYGGPTPFVVAAQTKSDAFVQVVNTTISLNDAANKADIDQIKQVIPTNLNLAKDGKAQELFDGSAPEFKTKSTVKDIASALTNSATYTKRNINVPGGTILGGQFVGQLIFAGVEKDEKPSLGTIGLIKEGDTWKLNSLVLPTPAAPAPAKKK